MIRLGGDYQLRKVLAVIVLVIAASFVIGYTRQSGQNETIQFYAEDDIRVFAEKLRARGIAFSLSPSGVVSYKVSDRSLVKQVADEVRRESSIATAFSFSAKEEEIQFLSILREKGINAKEIALEGKLVVVVSENDSRIASHAYKVVTERKKRGQEKTGTD